MNKIALIALSSMILASSSVYAADQAGRTSTAPAATQHKAKAVHHKATHHKTSHHKHTSHKKAESKANKG